MPFKDDRLSITEALHLLQRKHSLKNMDFELVLYEYDQY